MIRPPGRAAPTPCAGSSSCGPGYDTGMNDRNCCWDYASREIHTFRRPPVARLALGPIGHRTKSDRVALERPAAPHEMQNALALAYHDQLGLLRPEPRQWANRRRDRHRQVAQARQQQAKIARRSHDVVACDMGFSSMETLGVVKPPLARCAIRWSTTFEMRTCTRRANKALTARRRQRSRCAWSGWFSGGCNLDQLIVQDGKRAGTSYFVPPTRTRFWPWPVASLGYVDEMVANPGTDPWIPGEGRTSCCRPCISSPRRSPRAS